jgi:hypothetical protein
LDFIDNIEITFGPKLANGNQSLVLVIMFSDKQKRRFGV